MNTWPRRIRTASRLGGCGREKACPTASESPEDVCFRQDRSGHATVGVYSPHDLVSPRPRVNIDCTELLEHIAANDRFYDGLLTSLKRSSQPFLMTQYEDLFHREEQARILKFLGVTDPDFSLQEKQV